MRVEKVVLASSSPIRRQLLSSTGLSFDVAVADEVNEKSILSNQPHDLACERACAKAGAVARRMPDHLAIGADQVLSLGTQYFDKAESSAEARQRLRELSGRTHYLHSAFCIALRVSPANQVRFLSRTVVSTPMTMRRLSEHDINSYVATGEWQGCVGCYQFENRGILLFEPSSYDFSAVLGLPLLQLMSELRLLGVDPLVDASGPWHCSL